MTYSNVSLSIELTLALAQQQRPSESGAKQSSPLFIIQRERSGRGGKRGRTEAPGKAAAGQSCFRPMSEKWIRAATILLFLLASKVLSIF